MPLNLNVWKQHFFRSFYIIPPLSPLPKNNKKPPHIVRLKGGCYSRRATNCSAFSDSFVSEADREQHFCSRWETEEERDRHIKKRKRDCRDGGAASRKQWPIKRCCCCCGRNPNERNYKPYFYNESCITHPLYTEEEDGKRMRRRKNEIAKGYIFASILHNISETHSKWTIYSIEWGRRDP